MSGYDATTWVDGAEPALSAANLNKIEEALGAALGVDTVAALRAAAVPTHSLTAWTRGALAAGDGGGGRWLWDPASIATDDLGTVVQPTAATGAGRWVRVLEGPLSVAAFGVTPGGSAATNGAGLVAAVATAIAGRLVLWVPAGVHTLDREVLVTGPLVLRGTGPGSVLRHDPGATGFTVLRVQNATTAAADVVVQDLAIDGGGTGSVALMVVADAVRVRLLGLALSNSGGTGAAAVHGLKIGVGAVGVAVRDCDISGCAKHGIWLDKPSLVNVTSCTISGCKGHGIWAAGCTDVEIRDNLIKDNNVENGGTGSAICLESLAGAAVARVRILDNRLTNVAPGRQKHPVWWVDATGAGGSDIDILDNVVRGHDVANYLAWTAAAPRALMVRYRATITAVGSYPTIVERLAISPSIGQALEVQVELLLAQVSGNYRSVVLSGWSVYRGQPAGAVATPQEIPNRSAATWSTNLPNLRMVAVGTQALLRLDAATGWTGHVQVLVRGL